MYLQRASRQKKEYDPVLVRFYEERGMAVASKNYPMIQEAAKEIGQTVAQVKVSVVSTCAPLCLHQAGRILHLKITFAEMDLSH